MRKILLIAAVAAVIVAMYYSLRIDSGAIEEITELAKELEMEEDSHAYDDKEVILLFNKLHKYVEDRDINSLSALFYYPISREYPTRDILNEQEFVERYEEIFDEEFCNKIISNPEDWGQVGWRGYMYGCGDLWVDYSDSLIYAVNVYSKIAEDLHQKAIETERLYLHESIKVYATDPIRSFRTKNGKWFGRIDNISPVDNVNIQLSLYKSTTHIDSIPDYLFLGKEKIEGSAHNTYYIFNGKNYNFQIDNPYLYEVGSYPYTLHIEHNYGKGDNESLDIYWVYWLDLREEYLKNKN